MSILRRLGRRRIPVEWAYLVQCCYISWLAWLPALALGRTRGVLPYTGSSLLLGQPGLAGGLQTAVTVLFVLGSFGPLLAGLGVSARLGGTAGAQALLRRVLQWRVPGRWYLIALALPVAIILPASLAALLTGGPASPVALLPVRIVLLPVFQLLTMATGELGWRGVALALVQRRNDAQQSSYMVAIMWIIWSLPWLAALYLSAPAGTNLPLAMVGWISFLIGASLLLTWLYDQTASLGLCMLYMATSLTLWTLGSQLLPWNSLAQMVWGLASWLVGELVLRRYRARTAGRHGGPVRRRRR
ncbi:MAG: type II CAAX prenyl endopeptidase Rce1 family protein [Anaerolineae bacterium]|jgi:hypothetical protein|nr:hypothetical protein [Chloroflexota bacterium]